MNDVFLLLGSNLGDRHGYLQRAIMLIGQQVGAIVKCSSVYETQSWGKADAPDYLNQVVVLKTDMSAQTVLGKILAIEITLGRRRKEKWGPRTIDIDILFYGAQIIDEPGLQIPHPELHKRRFTIEPLHEIAPDMVHPVLNKTTGQLNNELIDSLIVKKL